MKMKIVSIVLAVLCYNFCLVVSSEGDRSPYYESCVNNCLKRNCTAGPDASYDTFTERAAMLQDPWARRLGWGCKDECRYNCMWRTVAAFMERNFDVPKFHGKWPFERILGLQEPVSMFASLMNLATHSYMYWKLVRDERFSIRTTPLLIFWHFFYWVCAHGWLWSALFHARDTPFTELMDYSCALSMVIAYFVAAVVRLLYRKPRTAAVVVLCTCLYYVEHVRYLSTGEASYTYNLTVNVIFGMLATTLWMLYSLGALCGPAWARGQRARRYVWRMVAFCKLTGASVLLELFDFPPRAWLLDAHALWHISTAPLPLLFYRFVIDDLDYLQTTVYGYRRMENQLDEKLDKLS